MELKFCVESKVYKDSFCYSFRKGIQKFKKETL